MSLSVQFLSLLVSFAYGLIMGFIYSAINRLVFVLRKTILRYLLEVVMMAAFSFLYVIVNVYINDGQINLYMLLCLTMGLIMYEHYYAVYTLYYMEYVMRGLKYIFSPCVFIFKKICGILKLCKKKVRQWLRKSIKKRKENSTSQNYEE
ncbi:MAG: spore cortex biosynthesis protein YabQ [Beduini sp.]|uniref:spore cortex biosynthesis protein YabQ n=1 Tax=Beduini sp. TaxID=1922300 RepID=UPI0011C98589